MKEKTFHRSSWLLPLAAVALFTGMPAKASIIISVLSTTYAAGSSGDSFDVTIKNTGASAQNIAAFSFGLSVADSHITFTGANESTALTYLFNGDSFALANPPFATLPTAQSVEASDLSNGGAGTSIAANSAVTFGLGHILFSVAGNASAGPIAVTLATSCGAPLCSSLSDSSGANVPFTVSNGTITVTTSGVPEPSSFLLALGLLPIIAWRRKK